MGNDDARGIRVRNAPVQLLSIGLSHLETILPKCLDDLERVFHVSSREQLPDYGLSDLVFAKRIEIKLVYGAASSDDGDRYRCSHSLRIAPGAHMAPGAGHEWQLSASP